MSRNPSFADLPALLLLASLVVPTSSELAAQAAPAPGDTIPLDPVEVTVLRTPIALAAAPLSVSVLGEAELRRGRSGAFLEEALFALPGVQVQNRYNPAVGERLAIRGFGARAQFGVRGVRILVDGIPATLPDGQSTLEHIDLGTLGRVEAIRGPASALYGNASGGVISFQTRPPASAPVALEAEVVGGSHGLRRGQTTASGTLDRTRYLVTVSSFRWDGFRTRPQDAGATYGAAERLGFNARVLRPVGPGELSVTLNLLELDAENPGSLPVALRDDAERPAWNFNIVQQAGKEVGQRQVGARWVGPVGRFESELSAYGVRRTVLNPIPSDIIDLTRRGGGLRAQFGRTEPTGWGALRWFVGAEAEVQGDDRFNFRNQQGARAELTLDQEERVSSQGLFAQSTLPLPGPGELLAGVRYDRHDFRATDRFPRPSGEPSGTGTRTMDAVSPSLGLHLPLNSSIGLFTSIGSFFETPSSTELANRPDGAGGFNPDLEPQRGHSVELGLRGELGRLGRWEVTGFRTALRNELIPFEVPDAPGRTFFRNAGSSVHQGAEATLSLHSVESALRAVLTYSLTNARFREFTADGEDLSGNRIPGLAPNRLQGSLSWTPGAAFLELTGSYLDAVPVNDRNTATTSSHTLWSLRAGLGGLRIGQGEVSPWVAILNLTDKRHTSSVAVNAFGERYFEPGPGRTFQLGLRAGWPGDH